MTSQSHGFENIPPGYLNDAHYCAPAMSDLNAVRTGRRSTPVACLHAYRTRKLVREICADGDKGF